MELGFLVGSIVKIGAILAYLYGLLWVLGHKQLWVKIVGVVAAFAIIQIGLTVSFGEEPILNDFDSGLIFPGRFNDHGGFGFEPDLRF